MTVVLVDTSVWVQHFREGLPALAQLLASDAVLVHPWVLGELACGTPPERTRTLAALRSLKPCQQATLPEVLDFIERDKLFGLGCGLVDLTLLASTRLTPGAMLWTLDRRLQALAQRLGLSHPWPVH